MTIHMSGRHRLNMRGDHRAAVLRNQVVSFILNGSLKTTKPRAKVVQQMVEKLVTVARKGKDFNTIRYLKQALPFKPEAVEKLVTEIAPKYVGRPGGYTRVFPLGRRPSDTAPIARLDWV